MNSYLVRRGWQSVLVLLGVSVVVFLILHLTGDPALLLLPPDATAEDIAKFRQAMGFDDPVAVQYLRFLKGALRGDFGESLRHGEPAMALVVERMPATFELAGAGLLLALCLAIPAGIISAVKRNTPIDYVSTVVALTGQAMPTFWLGIMLILVFSVRLNWLPSSGRGDLQHLILPAVTLGLFTTARITRLTRSGMLEVLGQDYIRTARAKGVSEQPVVWKHALKNASIPIVTIIGIELGTLLGGSVITETIFAWPGVGRLSVQAIFNRDYPVVHALRSARAGHQSASEGARVAKRRRPDARARHRPPGARHPGPRDLRLPHCPRRGAFRGADLRGPRDDDRPRRRLLRGQSGRLLHAAGRYSARLPLHPPRHRRDRRAGGEPAKHHHRHRRVLVGDLRARGARRGALDS